MKKIIEVLRLKHEANLSHEKIARACQLSKGVVSKYLSLAQAKGLGWPLPEDTDEAALEALLFPAKAKPDRFVEPDYFQVHQELKRKGVTLQLLWAEYVARHGEWALPLQPLLRALPGVAGSPEAQPAPAAPGR